MHLYTAARAAPARILLVPRNTHTHNLIMIYFILYYINTLYITVLSSIPIPSMGDVLCVNAKNYKAAVTLDFEHAAMVVI